MANRRVLNSNSSAAVILFTRIAAGVGMIQGMVVNIVVEMVLCVIVEVVVGILGIGLYIFYLLLLIRASDQQ